MTTPSRDMATPPRTGTRSGPVVAPVILLGIAFGGLFDGVVFHQILQWHHMVSAVDPPDTLDALELNTLADGLFHAVAWLVGLIAVFWLWRAVRAAGRPPRGAVLAGGILAGWGGFNLAEGLIDHQILGIHHVRPGPDWLAWDLAFLAWGLGMVVLGAFLVRRERGPA